MIRINLVRTSRPGIKPERSLVSRREAIIGGVLLVAAFGMLLYLASGPNQGTGQQEARSAPVPSAPQPAAPPAQTAETPTGPSAAEPTAPAQGPPPQEPPPQAPPPPPPQAPVVAPAQSATVPKPGPPSKAASTGSAGCVIRDFVVQQGPGGVTVTLHSSAEPAFKSQELSKPDRIALDIADCHSGIPSRQAIQTVEHPVLKRVRASQFKLDPPICRIVLDLARMPRYQVRPVRDGVEIRVQE